MSNSLLDKNGLTYLWGKLKAKFVPLTRTINGKALSANITLSASDVGASASGHTHDDRYYTESEVNTKLAAKVDKLALEHWKAINFGSTGCLYVGKFGIYDSQVTIEITSTTSVTYSGKLVIATQNYVIKQATVYGDAANTIAPNIYIKPSTTSDRFIEVYFKPSTYSKNVVHVYGSAVSSSESVCTSVDSIPSTATVKPVNALTEKFALASQITALTNRIAELEAALADKQDKIESWGDLNN